MCKCGYAMCFKCGDEAHKPASCAEVEWWRKQGMFRDKDFAWLIGTMKCPMCHVRVLRTEGCNHMTCLCRCQFCYICGKPWEGHGGSYYICNKPPAAAATADDDLYLFYHKRFLDQHDAMLTIHGLEAEVTVEWGNLLAARRGDGTTHDALTSTLTDAMGLVKRGRRAASWAYVHAFHIPAASVAYRARFQDSQAMLEQHLEKLHERCVPSALRRLTEELTRDHAAGVAAVEEWRRAVTQFAADTDKFLRNLLRAVEGGFVMSERDAALVAEAAAAHRHAAARGGAGAPS